LAPHPHAQGSDRFGLRTWTPSGSGAIRSADRRVVTDVKVASRLRIALLMVALATAGGITATIAHGDDPPATATFTTVDGPNLFHLVSGAGSSTSADIVTGGSVTFQNASTEQHNVDFMMPSGGGVSCQQTAGGTASSSLRFPDSPTDGTWSGVCTFTKPGTYSFMCDMHAGMTGTVVVTSPGAPPGTTTAPTTTTTPTVTATAPITVIPPGTSTPPSGESMPSGTPPASTPTNAPATVVKAVAFTISGVQRGPRVRGSINGAGGKARVKVALTAKRSDLGLKGPAAIAIGSLSALTTASGSLTFAVPLTAKAKAALAKRGHLTVTLRLTVPSAAPRTFTITVRRTAT
jgi:Copper binding proteins, plastocyanin/azurin family